jgi:hypothetical protein
MLPTVRATVARQDEFVRTLDLQSARSAVPDSSSNLSPEPLTVGQKEADE